jgi:hypothetical protein
MTDVYGEEDYYRDFDTRFPRVTEMFYERRLNGDSQRPSKFRVEMLRRTLDSNSGPDYTDGSNSYTNDHMSELRISYTKGF